MKGDKKVKGKNKSILDEGQKIADATEMPRSIIEDESRAYRELAIAKARLLNVLCDWLEDFPTSEIGKAVGEKMLKDIKELKT